MSSDVQWQLLRNRSSFLLTSNGVKLSRDPLNLTGKHSFKYSGVNRRAVGLGTDKDGNTVLSVRSKKTSAQRKPSKMCTKFTIKNNKCQKSLAVVNALIESAVGQTRPDLVNKAKLKAAKIFSSKSASSAARKMKLGRQARRKTATTA
eukprot:gnl/Spiro4/3497_TR1716_c0_g1_i1.p1 gnl/Spiro4/3497_TR1716_c0_g1~~gnl/Spiro4/3497_TR1716_c0_g1_i1.p1  ORF type:complete len:163 (+),score=45.51 gnl/Spiro4/3497_TR1716_c0_g1_i1:47-490(+)